MNRYRLSADAASDFEATFDFITEQRGAAAADRVADHLRDAIRLLAQNPGIGHVREDLTASAVLFWPAGKYLIVYRPNTDPLEIVAVLHSAQDVPRVLGDRFITTANE